MRIFQSTVKHGASAPGWVLVFLCVVALLSVSCSHRQQADPAEAEGGVLDMSDDLPNGLRMRIREASTPAPSKTQDRQVSGEPLPQETIEDRKSTRLNSSHVAISYAVFCWKKKKET